MKRNYRIISEFKSAIKNTTHQIEISDQTRINLSPRIRMTMLYAVAQSTNGRVVNTSNLSEFMSGYFTKFGDNCGDLMPLIDLTKSEVVEIGNVLGLPKNLVNKTPSDGISGKTDEDKLGYKYSEIDEYIRKGSLDNKEMQKKIEDQIERTAFKRRAVSKFKVK